MHKPWTVYELDRPIGSQETSRRVADGTIVFRSLPFYACRRGTSPPANVAVERVWSDYDTDRLAILTGFDWADNSDAHVYQLAVQVLPSRFGDEDPLRRGVAKLLEKGRVVVVAAGNSGGVGTLTDLAAVHNVISVGATTAEGGLLKCSSRGAPGKHCPTVAADGTDSWPDPFPPGTSFATVRVAELCVYLRSLLVWIVEQFIAQREGTIWPPPLANASRLAILDGRFDERQVRKQEEERRLLMASVKGEDYVEYTYGFHRSEWIGTVLEQLKGAGIEYEITVKASGIARILRAVASRQVCDDPCGCGAGFVSRASLHQHLSSLTPSKFRRWFGEETAVTEKQANTLAKLDEKLGPLLNAATVELLWHEYVNKSERYYVTAGDWE